MRILIAEDDTLSRMILEATVTKLGHEFVSTSDGAAAWQAFSNSNNIDVIISDRSMPIMDGLELCRRVRSTPRDTYTYFIFVTSSNDNQRITDANEAGADDYLVKPLDPEQLSVRLVVAQRITQLYGRLAVQQYQLERLNRQLFDQAHIDPLTQLGSRLKLREDLDQIAAQANNRTHCFCAFMCDIDDFKLYNDTYGHLAGDKVLESVAAALINEQALEDHAYRFGGEEFLLITRGTSFQSCILSAERYRKRVEDLAIPHEGAAKKILTISVGVARWHQGEETVSAWLKAADLALYRAKRLGRNQVQPRAE
jgi:two-component system chemotaxis response regulator CheY